MDGRGDLFLLALLILAHRLCGVVSLFCSLPHTLPPVKNLLENLQRCFRTCLAPTRLLQRCTSRQSLTRPRALSIMLITTSSDAFLQKQVNVRRTFKNPTVRVGRTVMTVRKNELGSATCATTALTQPMARPFGPIFGTKLLPCPTLLVTTRGPTTTVAQKQANVTISIVSAKPH